MSKPILIVPYIFYSKPIDSGYISTSPAIDIAQYISATPTDGLAEVTFEFNLGSIKSFLLDTLDTTYEVVNPGGSAYNLPYFNIKIRIIEDDGSSSYPENITGDIPIIDQDTDVNSYPLTEYNNGSTAFVSDTPYKYYIYLTYTDRKYNTTELFVTSKTFRTLE